MDHKTRAASCEATIKRECGLSKGESSYVAHPGTVDSCLQSIIISIYAGKLNGVKHGFVPIHVDSVTVWTAGSGDYEAPAHINTWVSEGSSRLFLAHSQMISGKGRLVLDLRGVRCVAYEAAVPQFIQGSQQKLPYWHLRWLPDLGSNPLPSAIATIARPSVCSIVNLLCHNSAATKILDIDGESTSMLLKNNSSIDISVSVPSEELFLSKKNDRRDNMPASVLVFDFSQDTPPSAPNTIYDLIVAPRVIITSSHVGNMLTELQIIPCEGNFLRHCHSVLTPGGLLLLTRPYDGMIPWILWYV